MNIDRDPDFSHLSGDVGRLFAISEKGSFFNLPGWYELVALHGLEQGARALLASSDHPPLALVARRNAGERILRSCTNLYTCEYGLLGDSANADAVSAFARDLVSSTGPLDGIRLEGLDPNSRTFQTLIKGLRAGGMMVKPYFGWGTWFEPTRGIAFAQYFSARPSVLRNTWKRKRAALDKSARSAIRFYRSGDDPAPLIAVYESVREQSWKAAEPFPDFIPAMIKLAAHLGALRLGILDIEGTPAAAQFWILWSGRATIFKLVYAEKSAGFSPGTLLTMEMMRTIIEEDGPAEIDFGRGDDPYKKLWLSSRRERWGIEAANPRRWRGLALAARLGAGLIRDRMKAKARGPKLRRERT